MSNQTREKQLVRASRRGDRDAFGTLVERYQSLVCGISYSITGDTSCSEEVAQETFLRAWRNLGQLKNPESFRSWLVSIVRNLARTRLQQRIRETRTSSEDLDPPVEAVSREIAPDDAAVSRERAAIVWSALEAIPETYREPMVLYYRQGRNVKQVAEVLDLSEQAVKQRLSRGRNLLRTEVAGLVEDVIGRTGPGKAFTVAVVAALPAIIPQTAGAAIAGAAVKSGAAAKGTLAAGLTGAILGPVLGMIGGMFGAWMSIRNTKSPRERRFVILLSIACFTEVLALLGAIFITLWLSLKGIVSKQTYWTVFAVLMGTHCILLGPFIWWANHRQRQIQREDGTLIKPSTSPTEIPRKTARGAFVGSVIGGVAWLEAMSIQAHDWMAAATVALATVAILSLALWRTPADRPGCWRRAAWLTVGLLAINLITVNLRWEAWLTRLGDRRAQLHHIPQSLWAINLLILLVFAIIGMMLAIQARRGRNRDSLS